MLTVDNTTSLSTPQKKQAWIPSRGILCCAICSILFTLISVTPLYHWADTIFMAQFLPSTLLKVGGFWLPYDFHWSSNTRDSAIDTNIVEALSFIALSFIVYSIAAFLLYRSSPSHSDTPTRRIILTGTVMIGLIYLFTPALISHDIFVYAGYGRTIVAHGANPYFVPFSQFPQDPLVSIDDWKTAIAAYGPLWLDICTFFSWLFQANPLAYILGYRSLGILSHVINVFLVMLIMRRLGSSERTTTLAMLLYAWNPLVLIESCLSAHNDIEMATFLLLGLFLTVRGQQSNFKQPGSYLPPLIAFTLATLIKFTAAPLIIFYLVLLGRTLLMPAQSDMFTESKRVFAVRSTFIHLSLAVLTGVVVGLFFYAPYWIGHNIHDIIASFSSPPSARESENSILRATREWILANGMPPDTSWAHIPLVILNNHTFWNIVNLGVMAIALLFSSLWLWSRPTVSVLIQATLATLGALLLVTPWFFPWYVIWIVSLGAVLVASTQTAVAKALLTFALTLSLTAFAPYLFRGYAPIGGWVGFRCLWLSLPPLLAFLLTFQFMRSRTSHREVSL